MNMFLLCYRLIVTTFQDLPNEMIYEILDYLDVCHSFESFFSLNDRFLRLLIQSPLPFKMDLSIISKKLFHQCSTSLIDPNQHRIVSLRLSNPLSIELFFSSFSLNQNFSQLECLVFNQIDSNRLPSILTSLASLPRLHSLTINHNIEICDSTPIYRLIFRLPFLKSCVLSPKSYGASLSLCLATNELSPLEHLSINRYCSLDQFVCLLSYTPELRRLSCLSLTERVNPRMDLSRRWTKVTNISLKLWRLSFDSFQLLCSACFHDLQVLSISTRADDHYLIADRWEQLIVRYLPRLRRFDFQHYWEPVDNNDIEQRTYHLLIDRFTTSFWIDRQWFFAHQHFSRRGIRDAVFYSTHPYRSVSLLYMIRCALKDQRLLSLSLQTKSLRTARTRPQRRVSTP